MNIQIPNNGSMICFYAQLFFDQTVEYINKHHISDYDSLMASLSKDKEWGYLADYVRETFPDQVRAYLDESA